jgi:hypothetical protein
MREQLIRYLLGELDADERRELQAELRDNSDLQRELEQLRECFAASDLGEEEELPLPGSLAERTAQRVQRCDDENYEALAADSQRSSSAADPPVGVLGWSLADLTVAGGVMLAVSMLVFPALRDSRDGTRLTVCQERQQLLYPYLVRFAEVHGGYAPGVRPNEYAGTFVFQLVRENVAPSEDLSVLLVCPASPFAKYLRDNNAEFKIPNQTELATMDREQLMQVTATMSPCFLYRFPHKSGDDYEYPKIPLAKSNIDVSSRGPAQQLAFEPLLSDAVDPQSGVSGHRGGVVLMTGHDGSVRRFCIGRDVSIGSDPDPFHNDAGLVAAGWRPGDIVLGASNAKPALELAPPGR